jgi:plasmid stabilization system protein ParE
MPLRGRTVPELRDHGVLNYREIIVSPWRIIYRVQDSAVIVLAVIDGRRSLEDVLLYRLL